MRLQRRILPACLTALWPVWLWTIYAQDQIPSFRAESDVVLVDVIVTDRKGKFIADLTPEEIQVFEDGKPQDIRYFRISRRGSAGKESCVELPASTGAYYAFLVDLQTLTLDTVERTKESIREFLRSEINPRDRFMLAAVGPTFRVVQPFTRDRNKLEEALDEISFYPWLPPALTPLQVLHLVTGQAKLSCQTLSSLSRHLGLLPNRKHILYFSRGYKLRMSALASVSRRAPKVTVSLTKDLLSVVDQANRNQVTVHSIDPRGLMAVPSGFIASAGIVDPESTHEFLAILSKDTGGLLATRENDLLVPIREAYQDGREFYLLGYVPNTKKKVGEFHEITVRVKREGLRLRHRKGYVDRDPQVSAESALSNAFKFPDLFKEFPFDLDVVRKGGKLAVRARIPTKALHFTPEGENNRCVLEIFGVVFDQFDEPTEKEFFLAKSIDLDFDTKSLEAFRRYESLGPWMEKDSPEKGSYLVVVLRQKRTRELAAAKADLEGSEGSD